MGNTVSLCTSKYCTTWMCSAEELIYNDQIVFQLHGSKQGSSKISQQWHTAVLMWPSYFIYQHKYQQTYKIMGCFDTYKLSDSGTRHGSITPVCVGALLVWARFCRANIMTVADVRQFAASRGARRSRIAAPLWYMWLRAAPLKQLASSYEHACKSSLAMHLMHACWIPDQVLGDSYFSWFFCPRHHQNQLYAGTFYWYQHCGICRFRVHGTVRSVISEKSFWLTHSGHCHQICIRKEISKRGFLDVSR